MTSFNLHINYKHSNIIKFSIIDQITQKYFISQHLKEFVRKTQLLSCGRLSELLWFKGIPAVCV